MCEPATLAAVSIGTSILGAGMTAYGQMEQGKAAAAQSRYQAAVQRNNQIINERQADDAVQRGRIAEQQQRLQTAQVASRQRASLAANGLDLNSGSAVDILSDTAMLGELDALTVRSNAEREAWGYRVQGSNAAASAGLLDAQASSAKRAGMMGAGASLLTGAGSVANKWYGFRTTTSPTNSIRMNANPHAWGN